MKLINKKMILSIALILVIIAGAYATENIIKNRGVKSGGIIKINNNGKVAAYISDDVLKKLVEENTQDDEPLKGPTLISAVNAAGVGNFGEIEIKGIGSNNSVTLKQKDVDENLILYVSSNGKVNLSRKGSIDAIVTNVNEINVK